MHGHHGPHGHVHGHHDSHQSGQSDGHVRHVSSGVFGIGTMGSSSSEGGYVRLSTQTHRDQQENPLSTLSNAPPSITHMNETIPDNRLLDIWNSEEDEAIGVTWNVAPESSSHVCATCVLCRTSPIIDSSKERISPDRVTDRIMV